MLEVALEGASIRILDTLDCHTWDIRTQGSLLAELLDQF